MYGFFGDPYQTVLKEGWLEKKGKINTGYQKRYVRLVRRVVQGSRTLSKGFTSNVAAHLQYFESDNPEAQSKGQIDLKDAIVVRDSPPRTSIVEVLSRTPTGTLKSNLDPPSQFYIETKKRFFEFRAKNHRLAKEWVDGLEQLISWIKARVRIGHFLEFFIRDHQESLRLAIKVQYWRGELPDKDVNLLGSTKSTKSRSPGPSSAGKPRPMFLRIRQSTSTRVHTRRFDLWRTGVKTERNPTYNVSLDLVGIDLDKPVEFLMMLSERKMLGMCSMKVSSLLKAKEKNELMLYNTNRNLLDDDQRLQFHYCAVLPIETCTSSESDGLLLCAGHLEKKGALNTMYRGRYFRLFVDCYDFKTSLRYYGRRYDEEEYPKGVINITEADSLGNRQETSFSIVTKSRKYYVRAATELECHRWMRCIERNQRSDIAYFVKTLKNAFRRAQELRELLISKTTRIPSKIVNLAMLKKFIIQLQNILQVCGQNLTTSQYVIERLADVWNMTVEGVGIGVGESNRRREAMIGGMASFFSRGNEGKKAAKPKTKEAAMTKEAFLGKFGGQLIKLKLTVLEFETVLDQLFLHVTEVDPAPQKQRSTEEEDPQEKKRKRGRQRNRTPNQQGEGKHERKAGADDRDALTVDYDDGDDDNRSIMSGKMMSVERKRFLSRHVLISELLSTVEGSQRMSRSGSRSRRRSRSPRSKRSRSTQSDESVEEDDTKTQFSAISSPLTSMRPTSAGLRPRTYLPNLPNDSRKLDRSTTNMSANLNLSIHALDGLQAHSTESIRHDGMSAMTASASHSRIHSRVIHSRIGGGGDDAPEARDSLLSPDGGCSSPPSNSSNALSGSRFPNTTTTTTSSSSAVLSAAGREKDLGHASDGNAGEGGGGGGAGDAKGEGKHETDGKATSPRGPKPLSIDLLNSEEGRAIVRSFLEKERSTENINFWEAEMSFRQICTELTAKRRTQVSLNRIKALARVTYEDYIRRNAPQQVNVGNGLRDAVAKRVKRLLDKRAGWGAVDANIFADARREVETMLARDTFVRIRKSSPYRTLKDQSISAETKVKRFVSELSVAYPEIEDMKVVDLMRLAQNFVNEPEKMQTAIGFLHAANKFCDMALNTNSLHSKPLHAHTLTQTTLGMQSFMNISRLGPHHQEGKSSAGTDNEQPADSGNKHAKTKER